jgi:predicted metal-dependent hydrolase
MPETLTVDDLVFEVRRSPRRRSMQITVDRGGELRLSGPSGCDLRKLEKFVRDKKAWIYGKLALKETLQQPLAGKEFVSGEGFSYLGRNYRLLLVDGQGAPLKLQGGRLRLLRSEAARGRAHLVRWYCRRAETWVGKHVGDGWDLYKRWFIDEVRRRRDLAAEVLIVNTTGGESVPRVPGGWPS